MAKSVLVTGSNRGIGLELVRQYSQEGWHVYATCRSPENALELNRLALASGGGISVHPLDVTHAAHLRALKAMLGEQPIDVLVNNAGVYGPSETRLGNLDVQSWLEVLQVNCIAPLKLLEAVADNLAASEHKLAVALTSRMGSIGDNSSGGSYLYRSSKAALNAAMKSAAIDLHSRGITVIVLHPGWVKTDMGGADAEITTQESVHRIRHTLEGVSLRDSGSFLDLDGAVTPW